MIEDGKEGYLVNPSNHLLYFQKIVKLLLNKDCRENFGKNARVKVEDAFSADQIAKNTLKHYQMVLNGRT
jgi:glycosyltransferase involved in cell wall biosynthesis